MSFSVAHDERIARLSERLGNLQNKMDTHKVQNLEGLDTKLKGIEEVYNDFQDQAMRKFNVLKDQLSKLQKGIEEEEEFREHLIESKTREVHIMENKIRGIRRGSNSIRDARQSRDFWARSRKKPI